MIDRNILLEKMHQFGIDWIGSQGFLDDGQVNHVLDIVEKENLPENAKRQGDYLLEKLKPFADKFASVGDVRGKGLMVALELVVDKKTRQPVDPAQGFANEIAKAARNNGVLVRPFGQRIILAPHLVYTREHCDQLIDALDKAFTEVDR